MTRHLLLATFLLLIPNLASIYYQQMTDRPVAGELVIQYFNFNAESNVPTFFSTVLLLMAAALLLVIARQHRGNALAKYWWALGGIFLFLALDESAQIHEGVTRLVYLATGAVQMPGYFLYAWVIPYLLATVVGGAFFFRFLLKLPYLIRNLFVMAGAMFVAGALGMEMLEGHFNLVSGYGNVYTTLLTTLEELLEMSGVILFIHALLLYVSRSTGKITLLVK
ncbi:MAG: multidrug transporter [Cytophagales bacterium]|nr:multidrug transporter [Cytophagales bacterium]